MKRIKNNEKTGGGKSDAGSVEDTVEQENNQVCVDDA
jgi:hypothetical protein